MVLSQNMKIARKAAGLSQSELGEKIGRGMRSIIHYEKGERPAPADVVQRWAKITGVTVAQLYSEDTLSIGSAKEGKETITERGKTMEQSTVSTLVEKIQELTLENQALKAIPSTPITFDEGIPMSMMTELEKSLNSASLTLDSFIQNGRPSCWTTNNAVLGINKNFTKAFGWEEKDIVGKPLYEVCAENGDRETIISHIKEGIPIDRYCFSLKHKKGYKIPVRTFVWRGRNGLQERINIGFFEILANAYETWGGFHFDESGDVPQPIKPINPFMFQEHFGYDEEEMKKLNPMTDLTHPDERERLTEWRKELLLLSNNEVLRATHKIECKCKHKDGHYIDSIVYVDIHLNDQTSLVYIQPNKENN